MWKKRRVLWATQADGSDGKAGGSSQASEPAKIEVDGKTLTVDEIKNVLAQQGNLTQKAQLASKLETVTSRYNVDADTYLHNAEASLAVVSELISKGIIDETGKLVDRKVETPAAPIVPTTPIVPGASRADATAMKALEDFHSKFSKMEQDLNQLREDNVGLMRLRISDQLAQKFPELDEQDISRVIATAYSSGSKKPVMEVAQEMVASKKGWLESQEKAWAERYGLNYEDLQKRKQFIEQGPEGGIGGLVAGKKISFSKDKKDPNAVTPREATKAFFEMQEKYRRQ